MAALGVRALACCTLVFAVATVRVRAQPRAEPNSVAPAVPAPAPVATDDEAQRTAIARAMFDEGLRFVDAAQWEQAADRFARVLEIRYSAVAAYNYGLAQARLGKLVLAAETLRKLTSDTSLDAKVRDPALALAAEVDAKVGWLTLKVTGRVQGCALRVDDQPWPEAAWGVAVPIDPGSHKVVLLRGYHALRTEQVEVAAGARVEQVLDTAPKPVVARVPTPAQVAASAPGSTAAQSEPSAATDSEPQVAGGGGLLGSPWFWVAVGVVVAGAVTTAVVATSSGEDPAPAVKGNFAPAVIEGKVTP